MKLNWNFLGGAGVQNKRPSVGGACIFFVTTQCKSNVHVSNRGYFKCEIKTCASKSLIN